MEDRGETDAGCKDQLMRLQAEFMNYRKRTDRERITWYQNAKADLVQKLLPVLDDFQRMLEHHAGDEACETEGVRLIYQNLQRTLENEGLEAIEAKGEAFDPEIHEAVGVEVTGDADRDGKVLDEWMKGYRFKEKLIRPSRVKVGRFAEKEGG